MQKDFEKVPDEDLITIKNKHTLLFQQQHDFYKSVELIQFRTKYKLEKYYYAHLLVAILLECNLRNI